MALVRKLSFGRAPSFRRASSFRRAPSFMRKPSAAKEVRVVQIDKATAGQTGITLTNRRSGGEGVLVRRLDVWGSARTNGVHVGDCLLAVNGTAVKTHAHAITLINESDSLSLTFWGSQPSRLVNVGKHEPAGLTLINHPAGPGVRVSAVVAADAAAQAGLAANDVILSINGVVVDSHKAAIELVEAATPQLAMIVIPSNAAGTALGSPIVIPHNEPHQVVTGTPLVFPAVDATSMLNVDEIRLNAASVQHAELGAPAPSRTISHSL